MAKKFLNASQLIDHINDMFGPNTLVRAADALALKRSYLRTGCAALDILLSGGLQQGRIHQFRGGFSSSKTWTLLSTGKCLLQDDPEAVLVLVDAENTIDEKFLEIHGYTAEMLERVFFMYPGCGEAAADAVIEVTKTAKKVLVVIDSVDALTPSAELDENMEKASYSPGARMMNKFMRKLVPVMATDLLSAKPRCTVLMVCQLREKIGVLFGDNSTTWGGKGKEFAASTIIKFARVAWLRDGEKGAAKENVTTYGLRVQAEIVKCKGPAHGESVEYNIYKKNFGIYKVGEYDNTEALLSWGVRLKLVEKAGKTLTYGKASAGSESDFLAALAKLPKTRSRLLNEIITERAKMYAPQKNKKAS